MADMKTLTINGTTYTVVDETARQGVNELSENMPTKTSQLTNDSGFLTSVPSEYITETELEGKGYLKAVPSEYVTETELNAKGYLTQHQDLSAYAKKTDIPTISKETWTFTLEDGSTVTKQVHIG